jgi:hypothetical protein
MAEEKKKFEIIENSESTNKKLIYQVPFAQVERLADLVAELEQQFSDRCYIDVEINTLEDAYINIAKEEERLLKDLQLHGMRRLSQQRMSQ